MVGQLFWPFLSQECISYGDIQKAESICSVVGVSSADIQKALCLWGVFQLTRECGGVENYLELRGPSGSLSFCVEALRRCPSHEGQAIPQTSCA